MITKTNYVKDVLLRGNHITSLLAFMSPKRITRLSAIIYCLRHDYQLPVVSGTPESAFEAGIISAEQFVRMKIAHEDSHFSVYYLDPTYLQQQKQNEEYEEKKSNK